MSDRHPRYGVPLEPTYTPADVEDLDCEIHLNAPGSYPFTRRRRSATGRGWVHRELSGEGDPYEPNGQPKPLIDDGEFGGMLRMAYDFPYDPHGFIEPPVWRRNPRCRPRPYR